MGKSKLLALVICFAILMSVFTSCSAEKKGKKIVKDDDTWFEYTRFKLEKNLKNTDEAVENIKLMLNKMKAFAPDKITDGPDAEITFTPHA